MVLPSSNPRDPVLESFSLDEIHGAAVFVIMRNRALRNADPSAMLYVYKVLQRNSASTGGDYMLQAQMRKEFGEPFERLMKSADSGNPPAPPEVSTQDIETALTLLRKLGRFEDELAGFVAGAPGKKTTGMGVQVHYSS